MKTQFIHIITSEGGVTLAFRNFDDNPRRFEIGAAFCSPTESNFSKKKGRLIAEGRMRARSNGYTTYARMVGGGLLDAFTPGEVRLILSRLRTKPYARDVSTGPAWRDGLIDAIHAIHAKNKRNVSGRA